MTFFLGVCASLGNGVTDWQGKQIRSVSAILLTGKTLTAAYHATMLQYYTITKDSHIFEIFLPVRMALCMLGLKMLKLFCTFL